MNAILSTGVGEWWQLAGWTMLHFLWLGTVVGAAAMIARLMLRHSAAGVRYGVALMMFAVLTALPVGIAVWVGGAGGRESGAKEAKEQIAAGFAIDSIEKGQRARDRLMDVMNQFDDEKRRNEFLRLYNEEEVQRGQIYGRL